MHTFSNFFFFFAENKLLVVDTEKGFLLLEFEPWITLTPGTPAGMFWPFYRSSSNPETKQLSQWNPLFWLFVISLPWLVMLSCVLSLTAIPSFVRLQPADCGISMHRPVNHRECYAFDNWRRHQQPKTIQRCLICLICLFFCLFVFSLENKYRPATKTFYFNRPSAYFPRCHESWVTHLLRKGGGGEIWFLKLFTMHPILVIPFQSGGGGEFVFTT